MKSFRAILSEWNTTYSDRSKLQHAYAVLAVASLLVAGVIGLINHGLGQSLLFLAIVLTLVFIGNGIIWAVINTFILPLDKPQSRPKKK